MVAGSLTGMMGPDTPTAKMMGLGMGFGAILIFPIMYGIVGGIGGAIGASIYNLVAGGWAGSKLISSRRIRFQSLSCYRDRSESSFSL